MRSGSVSQKVALMGCVKNMHQSLGATLRGKRPFRRSRFRWEFIRVYECIGDHGSTVDKVLCSKLEGRWFDSGWFHWNFSLA